MADFQFSHINSWHEVLHKITLCPLKQHIPHLNLFILEVEGNSVDTVSANQISI